MQATYVAANEFTVSTDRTVEFISGRRIKADCAGDGIKYCTVQSSNYSDPNTTVIIKESELTSNLTTVLYGIVEPRLSGSLPDHQHTRLEGSGGILSEYPAKDMYQDLLRNSIYLNVTWDSFIDESLINTGSSTMDFDPLNEEYDFTTGEILQSENLYDSTLSGTLDTITECMISIDHTDTGTPIIKATADGSNWETATNNQIHEFANTGNDLRIQFTASGTGSVKSWGILYNTDADALPCLVSNVLYNTRDFYYEGVAQDEDIIAKDIYFDADIIINAVIITARVAPTGSNITIDITKDDVEQSKIATLSTSSISERTAFSTSIAFTTTDKFGLKIKSIGSNEAGQGLGIQVHYSRNLQTGSVVGDGISEYATLPAWSSGFESKVIYVTDENKYYAGTDGAFQLVRLEGAPADLTQLLYPSVHGSYNDIYRGGWRPFWFNQQWGGAFGGERPYGHDSEHAWFETGHIAKDYFYEIGSAANRTWRAQGFKVSQASTVEAVWLKLYKNGNPQKDAEPLEVHIASSLDDGSGTTIVANGTANAINGHSMAAAGINWPITSNTDGEWYRFTFASSPTLAANTTYYSVMKTTGADAVNYFNWAVALTNVGHYPHGNYWDGDDATPANWTEDTARDFCFLIEATSATQLLQSGGQFDGLLKFVEGNPLDQSQSLVREMKDFWDDQEFTYRIVTEGALTASKPVMDAMWGFDHDRIVLYVDGSNHLVLKAYESDGTVHTVTGTTDVVAAGVKDIWVHVCSKNDGSDVVEITLNGTAEGTPVTSASILFDDDFVELGHIHLGGGFPLPPTWDDDEDMSALPSAGIYTYVDEGGAHEAASFSVQNGRLFQNWPTTNTWTYRYDTGDVLALNNANGWVVTWKCRIERCVNTSGETGVLVRIHDGTKESLIIMHEYYLEYNNGLGVQAKYQVDLTDKEHVFLLMGKGSDLYLFLDGKLILDATGLMTSATATNYIAFGDFDAGANSNGEAVWDYVKYYDGGELFPDVNAFSLSEFAYWSGDKGDLETVLYNAGTPYSVKEYCGIKENYTRSIGWVKEQLPITLEPTTTSASFILIDDMEMFVLSFGKMRSWLMQSVQAAAADRNASLTIYIDGAPQHQTYSYSHFTNEAGSEGPTLTYERNERLSIGLHKVEGKFKVSGGATLQGTHKRKFIVSQEGENVSQI